MFRCSDVHPNEKSCTKGNVPRHQMSLRLHAMPGNAKASCHLEWQQKVQEEGEKKDGKPLKFVWDFWATVTSPYPDF